MMGISFLLLLVAFVTVAMPMELCENIKTIKRSALQIRTLQTNFEIDFTWHATRGTSDVIIQHSDSLDVTVTEPGNSTLVISVLSPSEPTRAAATGLTPLVTTTLGLTAMLAVFVTCDSKRILVLIITIACLFASGLAQHDCDRPDFLHLLVPSAFIEDFYRDGIRRPVICKLHPTSEYSNLPSNNKLLFQDDVCTVREPEHWQQWLDHYFGANSTQSFYGDFDADGSVNVLEYYGAAAFEGSFLYINETTQDLTTSAPTLSRRRRSDFPWSGTDPTKADSDGDLLMDGFELAYGFSPLDIDLATEDFDADNLDNLNEQIHGTDPMNADSDGDGVVDGQEVANGADPKNPVDNGAKPPGAQDANVMLTIGDHSGSHSERYILHVGVISHQSPGYGLVGSGTYTYTPGTYPITLQHTGTNLATPDYDYRALLAKMSGEASVSVSDPQGILGNHGESSYFYASGKSATLTVEYNCGAATGDFCECAQLTTCADCKANGKCMWNVGEKICTTLGVWPVDTVYGASPCPCEECQTWYDHETRDTAWLDELNVLFPCPCSVTAGTRALVPVGHPPANWQTDEQCSVSGEPLCAKYHPGAIGCLRSATSSPTGARQQCCYGDDGTLLAPSHPGAGTPDKATEFLQHLEEDEVPFEQCCEECGDRAFCQLYKEIKRGDNSHCRT